MYCTVRPPPKLQQYVTGAINATTHTLLTDTKTGAQPALTCVALTCGVLLKIIALFANSHDLQNLTNKKSPSYTAEKEMFLKELRLLWLDTT